MGRLKRIVFLTCILQLHFWNLIAQEQAQEAIDRNESSDQQSSNLESVVGQLTNSNYKIEKSLDVQSEILEHIKSNDIKIIINHIYMVSNEKFSKIKKSVEQVNDRLTKIEEALNSSSTERTLLAEKSETIGNAVTNVQTKLENIEQTLNSSEAACRSNTSSDVSQNIARIVDCALAKHQKLTTLSTGEYHFNFNRMTYYEAKKYCDKYGMQLVTIDSNEEARAIVNVKAMSYMYWTSATDIGRTPGQFYWANGQPLEKWMWHAAEIKDHGPGRQTCAILHANFLIGDEPCSASLPLVCEMHPFCKNL